MRAAGASVVVQPEDLLSYLRGTKTRTGAVRPAGNTTLRMMIARYRHQPNTMLGRRIAAEAATHPDAEVRALGALIGASA